MFSTSSFKLAHKRLGSDCQIRTPNCSPSKRISSPQTAWFGLTNPNPKLLSLKTDLFPTNRLVRIAKSEPSANCSLSPQNRSVRIAKSEPHWAGICQSPASVDGSWSGNSPQNRSVRIAKSEPHWAGICQSPASVDGNWSGNFQAADFSCLSVQQLPFPMSCAYF